MAPYEFLILYSGVGRSLASSGYNMRVDEARAAAYALLAFSGAEYGKFAETNLRDVPDEIYARYGGRLPEPWRRRAEHWYTENARVRAGVSAWRRGDIAEFGRLVSESGRSSIYNWETGCPELQALWEISVRTDGVYGGRFSGAGFKGCFMAVIDPGRRDAIISHIEREYLNIFPQLKGKFASFVCHSADGVSP